MKKRKPRVREELPRVVDDRDEANQRLLDIAARADEREGIRQGEEDIKMGRTRPAREVLEEFRRTHKIPR